MIPVIFGDVHGEHDCLREMISLARERWGDVQLFGLGDYIDRGPDSKGVLDTLIEENAQGVFGNHELWFVHVLHRARQYVHVSQSRERSVKDLESSGALSRIIGGRATLRSYGIDPQDPDFSLVPQDHFAFLSRIPIVRRINAHGKIYWLSHAGIKTKGAVEILRSLPRLDLTEQEMEEVLFKVTCEVNQEELLWDHYRVRDGAVHDLFHLPGGGVQVVGHTPIDRPIITGHHIAIDTGCGRKAGMLSCVALLPNGAVETLSVPSTG